MGTGLDSVTFPGMGPLRGNMSRKRLKLQFSHIKQFQIFFFCILASYFLEMFISIRYICNQTAMGTGLDPVTFPGMGPLRGNLCLENYEN